MPDLVEAVKRQEFEKAYEFQKIPVLGMGPSLVLIVYTPLCMIFEASRTSSCSEGKSFYRPKDQPLDYKVRYPADNIADLGWVFANSVGNFATLGCLNPILNCVNAYNKALGSD